MQPVEDIWTCNRCGWTYPNHHPSAKHRRNHKKVCGKLPGYLIDDHHGHGNGGSSDELSSGDEASNHHEVSSAKPTETSAPAVESQSRSFDLSAVLQKSETAAPDATADEKSAAATVEIFKPAVLEAPKAESVIEAPKPVLGSAVAHPEEDIWICRECGWTYPNAHPSAKHRRNHKKQCPGKAAAVENAPGGSSDDDSDGEHHAPKTADVAAPAPTGAELKEQKAEPEGAPILTSTREFNLESVVPKSVQVTPVAPSLTNTASPTVDEGPKTPALSDAPVVAPKGSAVPHPDEDLWICKECGWTYPNHHPSAKHRRNHKKQCPGKVAAAAPAPGGSSDDDSGDEHHHQTPVEGTKPEETEASKPGPRTESVARDFDLQLLAKPFAAPDVQDEKKSEGATELPPVVQLPELSADPEKTENDNPAGSPPVVASNEETSGALPPAVESREAENSELSEAKAPVAPKVGSAAPHSVDDIWICKACGWTYPNHHPSAKHRRNHKKICPGKVASAAPAPGGSSDDDSGDEHHHQIPVQAPKPDVVSVTSSQNGVSREFNVEPFSKSPTDSEVKGHQPENGSALQQVGKVFAPVEDETPATPVILGEDVKEEALVDTSIVESKKVLESVPAAEPSAVAPKESVEKELFHGSSPTAPSENTLGKQPVDKSPAASKACSAVPHPDDDIWICKECGWTYPNHHPSAKHRRNHKKNCPGKVAAGAPGPGGSSDEDSGDEHHQNPVQAPNPEVVNVTNHLPASASVTREFSVESLASETQPADKAELLASPAILLSVDEAPNPQATADSETPLTENVKEDKPVERTVVSEVENVALSQESLIEENLVATTPPVVPKELSKEETKVAKTSALPTALSSAVAHPEGDVWKCRNCDWTYPNAHPSAKHRRNHKKHCPGEAAVAAGGGSSDDDSDHETRSSASAKEQTLAGPSTEPVASLSRDFQMPSAKTEEEATNVAPPVLKVEAPSAPPPQPLEKEVAAVDKSPSTVAASAPKASESAAARPEDPNDIWICKACGWTYPNAHPSAKHRRNHKKQCPGKSAAAVGHAPGGSSDDDSDDGSSRRGQTSDAANETAPVKAPVVKERGMPDLGFEQAKTAGAKAVAPKVEITERAPLAQLVSDERMREQEAKIQEERKSSVAHAAPHDPNDVWVCKECGWTYPNPHPSAKHRRNHKKVCKKTNSTGGGSSSDASSDDEHISHFGKKKCFPCL